MQSRIPLETEPFGITASGCVPEGSGIKRMSEIQEKKPLEKCSGFGLS